MMIRDASENDAVKIAYLHAESWRASYRGILSDDYLENQVHQDRLGVWQARFSGTARPGIIVLVAEVEEHLTGFACVFPDEDGVFGSFLDNLHVSPGLTGNGIGRKLLTEAARRLQDANSGGGLYLWVIEQNRRARQFYEGAGSAVVGSAVNSVPDGQRVLAYRCYWPDHGSLLT
jgi:ribosomal protein S18 acetylase RimI-like enzyme